MFGCHKGRVGSTLHFFSRRWADQYVTQVGNAICHFYHVDGQDRLDRRFHTVEFILARVKQEMANTPLDSNDNLAKILEVIREKTTVDYASLDADVIVSNYENRPNGGRIETVDALPVRLDMIDPNVPVVPVIRF